MENDQVNTIKIPSVSLYTISHLHLVNNMHLVNNEQDLLCENNPRRCAAIRPV